MDENINTNREDQISSIENKIWEYFSDLKLNNEQINKIKDCLIKELQQDGNWEERSIIKEKKLLKKYKKIIEECWNIEEWIKKIENELSEIKKDDLEINNKDWLEDPNNGNSINSTILEERDVANEKRNVANEERDVANEERDVANEERDVANEERDVADKKVDELLSKVSESYEKLNDKYKIIDQKIFEETKTAIPEETRKILAEKNITEEKFNEYIQYTIVRKNIYEQWTDDNTPETRNFLSNLKNLEDTLWIRTETTKWLPLTANTATFEANPDLKKFKDTDPEISKLWNTSYFWKENIDTSNLESLKSTLAPYKKMELIYKNDVNFPKDEKFQEISKKIFDEDYSNLTQDDINYYTTKLDGLNWWITDYIKWSAAQAPLTWILRYLDSYTWFNKDTLQDRFWKGKDEFITMQDSTMRIEWVIDGKPLSFYYDTKDWQTKICCDDVLHIENNKYQIYDWEWNYPRSNLKINMPSTKDIVSNLQNIDQDIFKKILEGSSDANDFKRNITDYINNKIKESFPENDEIKTRMWRFTEKNLAAQAFDSALIGRTEYKRKINEQTETWLTPIRKVLLLVDNTTEKSTSSDLVEFKWALKKLEWLLWKPVEEINKITDPVLRENLLNLKHGKEQENYENWETSIINFFKLFERRDPNDPEFKINIDDFSSFIDQWSKKENIKLDNFSKEFSENYEKMNPEKRLAQEQWKKIQELAEEKHERESEEADIELMASLEAIESMEIPTESNLW